MVRTEVPAEHHPGRLINLWHAIGLLFWSAIFNFCNRIVILGREHIPLKGERGIFILANHISAIDPFLIAVTAMPYWSPVWWRALAKSELFQMPFVGRILSSWGAIPVERGRHRLSGLERIMASLKNEVLIAFPEGRRSAQGQLLPGRPGIGKMIYDAQPGKILPVAIAGTDEILPKGRILPRCFKTAIISYGRPIDVRSYYPLPDSVDTSHRIVDEIMREIAHLQAAMREPPSKTDNQEPT